MDEFEKADAYLDAGEGDKAMPIFRKLAEEGRLNAMHSNSNVFSGCRSRHTVKAPINPLGRAPAKCSQRRNGSSFPV